MADDDKKKPVPRGKDLADLSAAINTKFKSNVSVMANELNSITDHTYVYSTGISSLDRYFGVGGVLGGRIMNIWGHEGTGKTLLSLVVGSSIQRIKTDPYPGNPEGIGRVAFLDAEGSYAPAIAGAVGINTDRLLVFKSTPERILTGEDYFDIIKILIQNGIELIIVDSVPALVPSSRMDATVGQGQKATGAAMMAEGLQQITPLLNGFKRSVVWMINQIRMKPMVMFGSNQDHTGGEAIKFFESYSLEVKKKSDIIKKIAAANGMFVDKRIGVNVQAELRKNKTASIPTIPAEFDIYFENAVDKDGTKYTVGVDTFKDLIATALASGVIKQSSSWFYYGELKANGIDALGMALKQGDAAMVAKLRTEVLAAR